MVRTKLSILVLMCAAALMVCIVVSGCGTVEVPPTESQPEKVTPEEETVAPPETSEKAIGPFEQPPLEPGDPFRAEYRFIVTGFRDQVDSAVKNAATTLWIEVERTDSLDLAFAGELEDCPGLPAFEGTGNLVIDHYEIVSSVPRPTLEVSVEGTPVPPPSLSEQVVEEINRGPGVYADLVWGTTNIGGSGDWHVGESPYDDYYIKFLGETADGREAFCKQWAFASDEGIRLGRCDAFAESAITGNDVLIGVFDTKPDLPPTGIPEAPPVTVADLKPYSWPFPTVAQFPMPRFRDHGLFVSGLVHAVAPDSAIVIYPVLDGNGLGDLYTLDCALHSFATEVLEMRETDETLKGAVINLSLGSPVSLSSAPGGKFSIGSLGQEVSIFPLIDAAASLRTLLSAAVCQDIAVVAAAGNQGGPADIPAGLQSVLAVSASTNDGELACYSNAAWLAAPGGGVTGNEPSGFDTCVAEMKGLYQQCAEATAQEQDEACSNLVMSWVTDPDQASSTGVLYAYSAGTSFSAPLVSGLVALMQEAGSQGAEGWVSPKELKGTIEATAHHTTSDYGIIDVWIALDAMLNTDQ